MTGTLLVNNLAGLLIITSLLVIIVKNPPHQRCFMLCSHWSWC